MDIYKRRAELTAVVIDRLNECRRLDSEYAVMRAKAQHWVDLLVIGGAIDPPAIPDPDAPLNVDEAAAFLSTTRQGIYSLVKRGKLRPLKGWGRKGKILFDRQHLVEYGSQGD